jgi:hypothetical protein
MTSWPGHPVVASSSSLDDDVQGAQFLASRIPNRALPKNNVGCSPSSPTPYRPLLVYAIRHSTWSTVGLSSSQIDGRLELKPDRR